MEACHTTTEHRPGSEQRAKAMSNSKELHRQVEHLRQGLGRAERSLHIAEGNYEQISMELEKAKTSLQVAQKHYDQVAQGCEEVVRTLRAAQHNYDGVAKSFEQTKQKYEEALQLEYEDWATELEAEAAKQSAVPGVGLPSAEAVRSGPAPQPEVAGGVPAEAPGRVHAPQPSSAPLPPPPPVIEVKSEELDEAEPLAEPPAAAVEGEVPAAQTVENEEDDKTKIDRLVQAAKRAAKAHEVQARQAVSDAGLPQPPPVPPMGWDPRMPHCEVPCDCGARCTRIGRMARIGRTYYRHRNHTCDDCHQRWLSNNTIHAVPKAYM